MEDANQTNNKLAWAILSKANGSQLSQVIKVTVLPKWKCSIIISWDNI